MPILFIYKFFSLKQSSITQQQQYWKSPKLKGSVLLSISRLCKNIVKFCQSKLKLT
jgi:hypothetical protein